MNKSIKYPHKQFNKLRGLQSFNPKIFQSNDKNEQNLCSLILLFALVWNDIKSIMLYYEYLESYRVDYLKNYKNINLEQDKIHGEVSGIMLFAKRQLVSILYEFFESLKKKKMKEALLSKDFKELRAKLQPNDNEAIKILLEYHYDESADKDDMYNALHRIRNKIGNHYDPSQIFQGYKKRFIDLEKSPFISITSKLPNEHRFYFADAASEEYYINSFGSFSPKEFHNVISFFNSAIAHPIRNLVVKFIDSRSEIFTV